MNLTEAFELYRNKVEEKENELNNVTDFDKGLRLITGGKEPPIIGDNWLSKLENGTLFLAKARASAQNIGNYVMGLFHKIDATERSVVLMTPEHPRKIFVDPQVFCSQFNWVENLALITEEENPNDGDRVSDDAGVPAAEVERHD